MNLHHAFRVFRRSPGFCLVAVATLGVAIRATVTPGVQGGSGYVETAFAGGLGDSQELG